MRLLPFSTALAAVFAASLAPALAQDKPKVGWEKTCDTASGRCTAMATLTDTSTGRRLGAFGLQIGKGGSDPVMVAIMPLGVGLDAGFRAVIGDKAFPAPFQVCFPDGCRATAPLKPEELQTLLAAPSLSFQFFPFSSDRPIAAEVPLDGLIESLKDELAP